LLFRIPNIDRELPSSPTGPYREASPQTRTSREAAGGDGSLKVAAPVLPVGGRAYDSAMWFRVTNSSDYRRAVVVEPWGDMAELEPGESIGVFWHGPPSAYVSVIEEAERIVLWAEGGRDVLLELDRAGAMDDEIAKPSGIPLPPLFHTRSDIPEPTAAAARRRAKHQREPR
jgi:hypothetical protein